MPAGTVETTTPDTMPDPSDFKAYDAWRESGGNFGPADDEGAAAAADGEEGEFVAPATGEEDQSLSEAEAELAAAQSEEAEGEGKTAEDETGEVSEAAQQEQQQGKKGGLDKRFRKLNNRIAEGQRENQELRERLARLEGRTEAGQEGEDGEIVGGEQTEPAAAATVAATRPKLSSFDRMEEWLEADSQWLQEQLDNAKAVAKAEKDAEIAQAANRAHQAEWDRNTARFADYNEVVTDDVKVSHAMTAVMKSTMSPEDGTRVAYYLGKHRDEALKIAEVTLAPTEAHWGPAQQRAAIALGKILAKIDADPNGGVPQKKTPTPAAKTATAKTPAAGAPPVSKANRPPAPMKGQAVQPNRADAEVVLDPNADYKKWEAAREREIARQNGRK